MHLNCKEDDPYSKSNQNLIQISFTKNRLKNKSFLDKWCENDKI